MTPPRKPPFLTTYWQNYPEPFYPGSSGQFPVPGWGARPVMAGPARVGVGAMMAQSSSALPSTAMHTVGPQDVTFHEVSPGATAALPWWLLPVGAFVGLAALGYVGTRKGWF